MERQEKVGFCITMYDEYNTVYKSLQAIKNYYGDRVHGVVVKSSCNGMDTVPDNPFPMIVLPNLGSLVRRDKLPAYTLSRNYGVGFSHLHTSGWVFDYIVALCGDTLVTDPSNFDRRYADMRNMNKLACVSQAIGQNFHSPDSDPINGKCGGRYQADGITDIMPQFFMLDGRAFCKTKAFATIPVVNEFTSEHCLGNELVRMVGDFKKNVLVLAKNAYDYNDGIRYQVKE